MEQVKEILNRLDLPPDEFVEIIDVSKIKNFEKACNSGTDQDAFDAYCHMHICQGTYRQLQRCPEFMAAIADLPAEVVSENGCIKLNILVNEKDVKYLQDLVYGKLKLPADMVKGEIFDV